MNLSNNTFMGFDRPTIPELSSVRNPSIEYLLGSNNSFTRKIPSFICELRFLKILDLSDNNFNGSIPRCMGNFKILNVESNRINDTFPFWLSSLPEQQVLVLRFSAFHGPIHRTLFPMLRIIDISNNHFNGTLPTEYFVKWSGMSSLGEINEDQSNEKYMGSYYYHDSIVLMNRGVALELVRILKIYTAIDFSGNRFEGEIPKSIGLLKELHVLNLSNNSFTGHIPSSMGNLTAQSLDISQNKLSGEIPQELGSLSFLAYMNFSHNQLSGLVPGGNQFQKQSCSSFEDNLGLFGSSLEEVCRDIHTPASHQQNETPETEEEEEEVISWIAAAIGFIPGIVFGLTIGYILVFYKPKWFMNPFGRNNCKRRSTTSH
ncbi:receptor-like protein 12 [Arabidopsis lyrata subsp. lyrata]|uniref:receptor-like protein 12 n=1 Tax=Arabidopsis lyrata subsp. lyrata TaxID=81972 RepID=UPI000A29DB0A|nr:receptor-like protein 12 [Arabidopsis lyrata subsp. lyrata]|eukprot:XP_020886582.1 receptor-like protein 12 [Arabidopsis lyrata subsp. lyrata]